MEDAFCREFESLLGLVDLWIICGDFNVNYLLVIVEIIVLLGLTLYHFNDISSKFPLVDFPIDRRMFTWSNWRLSPNMAKLDRFLVSLSCGAKFPQSFVNWLLSDVFDHVPIVLSSDSNSIDVNVFYLRGCGL